MHSSVSPNLLLIPSSVFFISVIYILQFFVEIFIMFLYSFPEFSEHLCCIALNSVSGKLLTSVSLGFLFIWGFIFFCLEPTPLPSFCLTFSV